MKTFFRFIAMMACCVTSVAAAESNPNLFRSEIAGIELEKPAGWQYQNLEAVAKYRSRARLKDKDFEAFVQNLASAPVVVASKHSEPYDSLNPSFQVLVRPLGQLTGLSGKQILQMVVPVMENGFAEFELVNPVTELQVDGLQGAELNAEYIVEGPDGRAWPTRATIIAVPRGSYLYQISFSSAQEGQDSLATEVRDTLKTVKFLD
ncbi:MULTISPECIES: hypothetical protein [Marinobacter]|uniref:hypothetical protein n=1 Tax=Marinobacter TaxID=2742 RepID=UPI00124935EA|nr:MULTISPECIES: hypothetical protein [Marinobacter]MBL3558543.1 hypothetical protein [Marinobacter sp. JB05H06]